MGYNFYITNINKTTGKLKKALPGRQSAQTVKRLQCWQLQLAISIAVAVATVAVTHLHATHKHAIINSCVKNKTDRKTLNNFQYEL